MHANIWIRKENEETWKSIQDKSDWLNKHLSAEGPPRVQPVKLPRGPRVNPLDDLMCKHGFDPRLCKFTKPGKICK